MRHLFIALMSAFSLTLMAQVTDYHAHAISDSYRELVAKHGMQLDEGFPLPQWSVGAHLKMMDEAGIDRAVLTLPAPHPYFGNQEECNQACRMFNVEMAEICQDEHFTFCATLPLPDVEAAIAEAKYALDTLGAVGVKLATNVYGQHLGDSMLDPLMELPCRLCSHSLLPTICCTALIFRM